jgi:hypothetical protein
VNFPRIPVGSTLEGLFIEMWHGGIIKHRSYTSSEKMLLSLKILKIYRDRHGNLIGSTI